MELGLVGVVAGLVGMALWLLERGRWRREIAGRRRAADAEIASAKQAATHEVAAAMRDAAALAATTTRLAELRREVDTLERVATDGEVGLLPPVFQLGSSSEYKQRLSAIRDAQQKLVRDGGAIKSGAAWEVGDCRVAGERMQKQYGKLMLRAFNAECEAALAKLAWNNAPRMLERVAQAFESINKLASSLDIEVAAAYRNLRLDELKLEHELAQKRREEQEDQREVREQLRDEELAYAEAKQVESDALAALAAVQAELAGCESAGLAAELTARAGEHEAALAEARSRTAGRAGHVYVLSNAGAFGDKVLVIGMTRRANPLDRVRELEAGVPFPFDVHALIPAADAAALEQQLHRQFADRRVNLAAGHCDFFAVTLDEVEAFAKSEGIAVRVMRTAEAQQYRETLELRRRRSQSVVDLQQRVATSGSLAAV